MKKLNEKKHSKTEKFWMIIFQFIGFLMFIIPLFKTFKSWLFPEIGEFPITFAKVSAAVVGIFLVKGGDAVGTVVNNIGIIITDVLKKIASTK